LRSVGICGQRQYEARRGRSGALDAVALRRKRLPTPFVDQTGGDIELTRNVRSSTFPFVAIGVGEKDWLVYRQRKYRKDKAEAKRFADALDDHFGIEVTYCSLANECAKKCSTPSLCP
jgi:hypothetical protein